ncbi:similar to Saccharomyces cerevisiae YER071C TDA2 Protein of unknown function [Maudiozyma saulgeensis]|uniref:Topoisomerase I damage affected protein 2 n=1 Tax=Maudiozyma saulgeensis TaxID=1789683 RepID=A0A1X7R2R1_9SACH|nr:similar to Saccharomyces cerevisiae YER071C TDA2 Protein of unknown function [Kazachstania saulgeensis]
MTSNITIQDGKVELSPFDSTELSKLLQETMENIKNKENDETIKKELKNTILSKLNQNSSQYKYIISITTLANKGDANDITITNDVGALWSPKKDGLLNFQLLNDITKTQYFITVFYIFK